MKRLFRCPSGSWPVAGGYGTAEEDKESRSVVGWVRLPTRLVGWVCVKVTVDMRCRGMLLRGKLSLSRKNMCMRARVSVCRGASFNTGDLAGRVLGYRKQASCDMQSEQS